MAAFRALVVVVVLSGLAACKSNDGTSESGTGSAFRNLGKRGDSDLAGRVAGASAR